MDDFADVYLPTSIAGYEWHSSPRFSTTITQAFNGKEQRNRNWRHHLNYFTSADGIRCFDDIDDLRDHFLVLGGPFLSFPLRDPMDFASAKLSNSNVVPTVFSTDQVIGTGDGATRTFQLQKTYTRGSFSYTRPIYLPVVDSVVIAIDALDPDSTALDGNPYDWDVSREGGLVTFDKAPEYGMIITAGFLFDNMVRFEADDSLDAIVKAFKVEGFAQLTFMEIRPCFSSDNSET